FSKLTQDAINGGPLVNGQEYYFAVTAYNRNTATGAAVTTLESSPQVQICVPQAPPPGKRYNAEAAQLIASEHVAGTSDGIIQATVVDPTQTTGDSYKVAFGANDDGETVWSLINTSTGKTLIANSTDQSGSANYVGAEGFEISVSGPPPGMKDWDAVDRFWTWGAAGDWGAEGFSGAITGDPNNQWFEATTLSPADLRTVEIRFTAVNEEPGENQYKPLDVNNEDVSYAYRYLRAPGADPPAIGEHTWLPEDAQYDVSKYIINTEGDGYVFQDRVPICLSAWDIESDPPRRLEVGFLENNQPGGHVNGAYGPAWYSTISNIAGGGPREWLFIFGLDYTDPNAGQNSNILLQSGLYTEPLPHMWIVFADRRQEAFFPQEDATFTLLANHVNTPTDEFTFAVPGTESSDELAAEDAELINLFPNPYYGVNTAETSPYSHFVTFSHLPPKATIRIYDLSGSMVRKIEKDDPDQFLRWDLTNTNELPVASGLYIAHIDLPDLKKEKVLKFAIVQEQQFLQNY
ncbi:MAG: hypothetical protein HOC74_18895, partial [Gemmatimonadetes bacterium]|nr:hypothetical protein [Gemmatimonadota bacterium]